MNKLLNNLLGMYKQAKLNKKAESYKSKVAELLNDINEPSPIMDYISESEAEEICKAIGIPHEASWYKGDLLGYIDEVPDGMVDVLIEHISEEDAESLWRRIAHDMGMDVDAKKQTKMSKKAEEKESAKKDYTEQYAKVKEIMKEYGYGLSDGGYIYLISKEQPKDEGFQVKFKGDRLRVELDGKLKYSGYGPEAIEDFLKGMFYAKKLSSKAKAFRKLCLKRAFHKTAGEFEEMMKLKSTDPKLISYLAKEFGVEESTVSQYTDVSENAEELYNILEQQANKYGYEWDKFEYDEYGDRIDENDFRGDTDDLEKAVEYIKNNIDKSMFKLKEMGVYQDDYFVSSEYPNALIFSINEKLIPTETPVIYITNNTKNYDIDFFAQSKKSKEEDETNKIYVNSELGILIRRANDEIAREIVNYVNVELPKKIEEQNKKQSSKAKIVRKQAKYEETVQGDEKVKDSAKSFGYDIKFAGHYGRWIYYYLIDEKGNIIRDDKEYQKVYDEMKKRIDDDIDINGYDFVKALIEEVDGELMRVPTIVISEYSLLPNHKDREENTGLEEFKRDFNLSSSTKKKAGIDPNVSAEDILKLNFDMPIEKADKVKEQFNEKGIKYESRKGKYTVEFSVDIEASKVDLVYEIIRNIKKSSSTKKQAIIKHENGVYNVYSESGKCLGKGYKTKEEAEKRLKQVEYFKHKSSLKQVVISKMAKIKK